MGWPHIKPKGQSKGLISMWKEDVVETLFSFIGGGFLGLKVKRKDNLYYVINIHSLCNINQKRQLWRDLINLKIKFVEGEWC